MPAGITMGRDFGPVEHAIATVLYRVVDLCVVALHMVGAVLDC